MLTSILHEEQRNYAKARYELQTLYHESYIRFHRKIRSNEAYYNSLTFKWMLHSLLVKL